jgi:hypothetical protein
MEPLPYVSGNQLRHTDPTGFAACFGCPEDLASSTGSEWTPALDLTLGWMDDDAFFEYGAAGIFGSGFPGAWSGWLTRP